MLDRIREKREEIYAIARKHKAEKLWGFGSCARGEERADSDVDILFDGERIGIMGEIIFKDAMAQLLGVAVDIVHARALQTSPCFAYNVRKDMVAL